jgi:hypothetical protein
MTAPLRLQQKRPAPAPQPCLQPAAGPVYDGEQVPEALLGGGEGSNEVRMDMG